jgi:hypothetical protein
MRLRWGTPTLALYRYREGDPSDKGEPFSPCGIFFRCHDAHFALFSLTTRGPDLANHDASCPLGKGGGRRRVS